MFKRQTLSGEHLMVCPYLMKTLIELGLHSPQLMDAIIEAEGSIQGISCIPDHVKAVYKTVSEVTLSSQLRMAADRGGTRMRNTNGD